jgi:hypothetical protein
MAVICLLDAHETAQVATRGCLYEEFGRISSQCRWHRFGRYCRCICW